jgi:5'-3' exonuclease
MSRDPIPPYTRAAQSDDDFTKSEKTKKKYFCMHINIHLGTTVDELDRPGRLAHGWKVIVFDEEKVIGKHILSIFLGGSANSIDFDSNLPLKWI